MRFTQIAAYCSGLACLALASVSFSAQADDGAKKVNIWNWSDYIAEDTVSNFSQTTGLDTNYVLFDSNELVEARLLSGSTGFDAIMMTSYYVPRLAAAGALEKIDKSKLTHYQDLDPKRMELLATVDANNDYAVPYTEISLGIGYNTKKIEEIFGPGTKIDSWEFLFDKDNAAKLKKCGIAVLDSPVEVISAVQHYLKKDPATEKRSEYEQTQELLTNFAKNVAYFHSSRYINDLASGDICVAIGYSGDILQANDRAIAANRDYNIEYVFPKEGSLLWFDCWIMPKNASHADNGLKWIDYLLDGNVASSVSNEIRYILPVKTAIDKLDPSLASNPSINLTKEKLNTAYFPKAPSARLSKIHNQIWNSMKLNSTSHEEEESTGWE